MKVYKYSNWTAFRQKLPKERARTGYYYEIKLFAPEFMHSTLFKETTFFTKRWGWKREIKDTVNYLIFKIIFKENE